MSGKTRNVHFFEMIKIDQKNNVNPYHADGLKRLHTHTLGLPEQRLKLEIGSQKVSGSARTEPSTLQEFFYIGKTRNGSDWPDMQHPNADPVPLQLPANVLGLIEPAYIVPISGTQYLAAVRTQSAPSWSMIEKWLTSVTGGLKSGYTVELRPYVREDQLKRLRSALGATKLHIKFDSGDTAPEGSGEIGKALASIQETSAFGASVELTLSFGNAKPDELVAQQLVDDLRKILDKTKPKAASATLLRHGDEDYDAIQKDHIDFIKERVTERVEIGTSPDDRPSTAVVLSSINDAIQRFRKRNKI